MTRSETSALSSISPKQHQEEYNNLKASPDFQKEAKMGRFIKKGLYL
jgi:hypothetical protein